MERLFLLLETLKLSPSFVVNRAGLEASPVGPNNLLQGLKEGGHAPLFPFQKELLGWAATVILAEESSKLDFPAIPVEVPPAEVFEKIVGATAAICSARPLAIRREDAQNVTRELARAAYILRSRGFRADSADFLTAAFSLQSKSGSSATLPLINRSAGYLAVELGVWRATSALLSLKTKSSGKD